MYSRIYIAEVEIQANFIVSTIISLAYMFTLAYMYTLAYMSTVVSEEWLLCHTPRSVSQQYRFGFGENVQVRIQGPAQSLQHKYGQQDGSKVAL